MGNNITIVFTVIYFFTILVIGFVASKKTATMRDFMVAGQSLGVWVTSLGIMAAVQSGWTWLGNPGACYSAGYAGGVKMQAFAALGLILSFYVLAKPVRIIGERFACYTFPDILAARWDGNHTVRLLSSLVVLLGSFTYLVSQWASMGTALEAALGIRYKPAVIIGAIVVVAYVVAGGMLASMWTNFIQMIIMFFVSILLVSRSVNLAGGFEVMNIAVAEISPSYVAPWTENVSYCFLTFITYSLLVVGLGYGGQPSIVTKFLMIKSTNKFRWAPLICVLAQIVGCSTYIVGIAGLVLVDKGLVPAPARPDLILMNMISSIFPPTLCALILVAVFAAIMSTAESFLFNSAGTIVRDFGRLIFKQSFNDKQTLKLTRLVIMVVAIITIILALEPPAMIATIGSQAFGTFCAGFGPLMYLGLRWKRVNSKAAIAGLFAGLVIGGIIPIIDMVFMGSTLFPGVTIAGIGVVVSAIVIIIVSLTTEPEHSEVFD